MIGRFPPGGPFAAPGPWVAEVTNGGERYLPLVKPYDAAMHLGHMASYREALRYSHGRRVLDIGCGTGYGAFFLASHGARRVCAVDLGASSLGYAATVYRHPRVSYAQADALNLPFAGASFDFVFCSQVIEHVPSPEQLLREIRRVLSPDGFCLITTPNRALFSPAGASDNVHHVSEMDAAMYAATAGRVFPRVEIRGIPQRCLTLEPGQLVPTAKPAAELRPEDYRVQRDDVESCENLLCFAHVDPDGAFAPTLPPALEHVADELAPIFWDPEVSSWAVMALHPPDAGYTTVPLGIARETSERVSSPRADLYRVEVDTVGSIGLPVRVWLCDEAGRTIVRRTISPLADRISVTFDRQPDSQKRSYALALRLAPRPAALRHLFRPAQIEARSVSGRSQLAVRTFHELRSEGPRHLP